MFSGDNLSVSLFFIGLAAAFYIQTLRPEIRKVRILMLSTAVILLVIGVAWPFLGMLSPAFATSGFAISLANFASSPLTWFTLLMVLLIASSLIPTVERWQANRLPVVSVVTDLPPPIETPLESPRDAANREKIVVLARAYAQPAYAVAQQVTNRLWDRMRNSDDMKDQMIAVLGNRYVFKPCNHASAALSDVSSVLINELDGPDKNDIESLQQYLKEFFDAYQDLIEWTNLFTQLFSFSLRKDPEYDMWQEKHKLFYEELTRLIAADDFS